MAWKRAAALLALALLLYRRRALETAGDAVAVPWLRPVFKYFMALGGALALAGVLFWVALVRARRRAARGEEHVPDGNPRSETE